MTKAEQLKGLTEILTQLRTKVSAYIADYPGDEIEIQAVGAIETLEEVFKRQAVDPEFCKVVDGEVEAFFSAEGKLSAAWKDQHVSSAVQDVNGWKDEKTGEEFPPTYDFVFCLYAFRVSDDVAFCVHVRVPCDATQGTSERSKAYIRSKLENGKLSMESYADCPCQVNKPCERHSAPLISQESPASV